MAYLLFKSLGYYASGHIGRRKIFQNILNEM